MAAGGSSSEPVAPKPLAVILVVRAADYGPRGTECYRMWGRVTFEGKPDPRAVVSFMPAEKGIEGGFTAIKNGRYGTVDDGRGQPGGEHTACESLGSTPWSIRAIRTCPGTPCLSRMKGR